MAGRRMGRKSLEAEDVDRRGRGEGAGGQGHAAQQVEADPQPPGVGVVQVADGADAGDVADHRHREPQGHEAHESRRDENAGQVVDGRCLAVSWLRARLLVVVMTIAFPVSTRGVTASCSSSGCDASRPS